MKTGSRALIGFLKDCNEKEPWPTRTYQMTRAEGFPSNKPVGIAHGESTKFFLVKTFDRLKIICHAVVVGWNGPRRFEELEECLAWKALSSFRKLVRNCYPNPTTSVGRTVVVRKRPVYSVAYAGTPRT